MKFLMTWLPDEKTASAPPNPELMAEMDKFVASEFASGVLLSTGGLLPSSMGGARARSAGGAFTVTDGPFTESKEMIAGYAIVNVASLAEAIDAARRFTNVAGDGECEIRMILDGPPDFPAQS